MAERTSLVALYISYGNEDWLQGKKEPIINHYFQFLDVPSFVVQLDL